MSPDDPLTDDELQEEITLVGALVIEATASDGPMDQEHIDAILGVDGAQTPPSDADDAHGDAAGDDDAAARDPGS
ncbi:hypothetical protein [Arthrobacter sp. NEB 688]|uniref:hypothetical protein n=1 Tax=Arthrobacter sp. NEB 688 TaxID=904039 RepID=UPI0015668D19|nr:hypothetical protein [Arthrobacter sp. NEB 688]QKE82736.1 hypothetical protein HL663_01380 [Arthrobacter sp. NEB 688]